MYDVKSEFESRWLPFVKKIVRIRFGNTMSRTQSGAGRFIRRAVDTDDLIQVGCIALLEAAENYDPSHPSQATFETYATRAICHQILNYIEDNMTSLKAPRLHSMSEDQQKELQAIFKYRYLSEVTMVDGRFTLIPPDKTTDHATQLEDREFNRWCIRKLYDTMSSKDFLLLWNSIGRTMEDLGQQLNITKQHASREVARVTMQAMDILYPERRLLGLTPDATKQRSLPRPRPPLGAND